MTEQWGKDLIKCVNKFMYYRRQKIKKQQEQFIHKLLNKFDKE